VIPDIYVFVKLDDNPDETTWEVKNSSGTIIFSGGPYTNPQEFIKDTLQISDDDCYTFIIYDEGGDGLTNGGYFALRQSNFSMIYQNNSFANTEEAVQFAIDILSVPDLALEEQVNVYPNPFTGAANISFTMQKAGTVELRVFNLVGEVVFEMPSQEYHQGTHNVVFDGSDLNSGLYFLNIRIGDKTISRKITLR
jgi:hypothetical protein